MRMSDWSSDVCSSDLHRHGVGGDPAAAVYRGADRARRGSRHRAACRADLRRAFLDVVGHRFDPDDHAAASARPDDLDLHPLRSEAHTSKLQSLMRNSSAVFCLKKKTTAYDNHISNTTK